MKIKVLSVKAATATGVYYLAIVALLALVGVIVFKTLFSPPCSIIGQHECVVDGWSVAGLAATILGVAATLLAVLGAVAVAAWWANLDNRVDGRVDAQMKVRVDQILEEQARNLKEQTTLLLQEQKKSFEETLATVRKEMDAANKQVTDLEARLQSTQKTLLIGVMLHEPWIMENWANEVMLVDPTSEVAVRMVLRYLRVVEEFFPIGLNDVAKHMEYLEKICAPDSKSPIGYWNSVLRWQQVVNEQQKPAYISTVKDRIDKLRPMIEAWKPR